MLRASARWTLQQSLSVCFASLAECCTTGVYTFLHYITVCLVTNTNQMHILRAACMVSNINVFVEMLL